MLFTRSFLLLIAPLFVAATPTTTASATGATQSVQVGAVAFSFTPNTITANVGDIIEFRFYPQNHSVSRADFKNPCIPYEVTGPGRVGFWSGFKPIAVVLSDPPTFRVLVNDTEPIFFYCAAPGACASEGMVGVINPNATQTFATQQAFALNSTTQFAPGEYFPAERAPTGTSKTNPPTSSPTSNINSITTTNNSSSKLSTGAIVGIVIAGLAVLLIFAALIYVCGRQKTMGEILRHSHSQFGSLHYGATPVSPSAGFFANPPNQEIDVLGRRFSQTSPRDRTTFSGEFRRGGSPLAENGMGSGGFNGSLNDSLKNGNGNGGMAMMTESPVMGKPTPKHPAHIVPLRVSVPEGPVEMMSNSDRDYVPGQSPGVKEKVSEPGNVV